MGWSDNIAAGADKKLLLEQDKVSKELLPGAQSAFYDQSASDPFKADLNKRMAEIAARNGAGAATAQKTTFGSDAYGTAARVAPATMVGGTTIARPDAAGRLAQAKNMEAFMASANGGGPSVAPAQQQQANDAALAAFMRAKGARGARVNPALTGLTAGREMGGMLHEGGLMASATRAKEAADAANKFGSLSAAVRDQDIGAATAQAKMNQEAALYSANAWNANALTNKGLADQMGQFNASAAVKNAHINQEVELANLDASLRARGMNDQQISQYMQALQRQQMTDKAAKKSYWEYDQDLREFNDKQMFQKKQDIANAEAATASATASVATMGMKASDERVKRDVAPGAPALRKLFNELKAYEYEYKDPSLDGAAPGKHVSVMAQDLEKTDLGKSAVVDSPDGVKRVDSGRLAALSFAAIVDMNKRIKAVEKRKGK